MTATNGHGASTGPQLYFLDIGMGGNYEPAEAPSAGKVMTSSADGSNVRVLIDGQHLPDGIDISPSAGRLFWTNMGKVACENDGCVQSANLDGSDIQVVIPSGKIHTPKQIQIDQTNSKLYICDREGLRVHRCDFDGQNHEILVKTGDFESSDGKDQTKWCVGITVDSKAGKFYWTHKGGSKAGQGRIYRANVKLPEGETAESRSDIEVLFEELPEPIDLEVVNGKLYWTDRGEYPLGNTLNVAEVADLGRGVKANYKTLARHFHEAIGLKIDAVDQHIYVTDLGGTIYRFNLDGADKRKIYDGDAAYSGIGLAHLK